MLASVWDSRPEKTVVSDIAAKPLKPSLAKLLLGFFGKKNGQAEVETS